MIASLALLRVHVLVVELPGRPLLRLRAEAAVRARGWVVTTDPEDTDLVLVCGTPRPDIVEAVDALWRRVPVPRARRTVRTAEALGPALDSAARVLADPALQRQAAARAVPPAPVPTTRLGPLAPDWPSGLAVDCALDGGRIAAVGLRRVVVEPEDDAVGLRASVLPIADAARLLRLAGWPDAARRLDGIVDRALDGTPPDRRRLRAVTRAVRRSATLAWVLAADGDGVDVRGRVLALLSAATDGTTPPPPPMRRLVGHRFAVLPLLVAATEEVPSDA